jgi:ribonuclease P/MRP protein subunit RPP25
MDYYGWSCSYFLILLFFLHLGHCNTGFSNGGAEYDDENADFEGPRGYRGRGRGRGRRGSFGPGRGYGGDGYVNEESGGYYGGEYNAPPPQGYYG